MRLIRFGPPIVGACMFAFALFHVAKVSEGEEPRTNPPGQLPLTEGDVELAGSGIVEPATETVQVGTPVPGVAGVVDVRQGEVVDPGKVLVRLNAEEFEADVRVKKALLNEQNAKLARLKAQPRPEELPAVEARLAEAKALALDQKEQLDRNTALASRGAIGVEELRRRELTYLAYQSKQKAVEGELELLKAGAWKYDLQLQQSQVASAEAHLAESQAELDRRTIRAPIIRLHGEKTAENGEKLTVLQVNVRPGEQARPEMALMLLGGLRKLHVRADFDENELGKFSPSLEGEARTRGKNSQTYPLRFVRIDPYLVPKSALRGAATERVDSRVLQVIYQLPANAASLFVGQQVDVFLYRRAGG